MREHSRISPVAQLSYQAREHAIEKQNLLQALKQAALQNFKLKQEVTGGLQIVWALANKQPDKKIVISAVDLVAAMGSLRRSRDEEKDEYTFEAVQPTEEDFQDLGETIAGTKPPLGENPFADEVQSPRPSFDATGQPIQYHGNAPLIVQDEVSEIPADILDAAQGIVE